MTADLQFSPLIPTENPPPTAAVDPPLTPMVAKVCIVRTIALPIYQFTFSVFLQCSLYCYAMVKKKRMEHDLAFSSHVFLFFT